MITVVSTKKEETITINLCKSWNSWLITSSSSRSRQTVQVQEDKQTNKAISKVSPHVKNK